MTEENRLRAFIDFIPGHAPATCRIGAHRADLSQVAGHLLVERHAGAHTRVNDEMRAEIDCKRQRSQVSSVTFAICFEFNEGLSLFLRQAHRFTAQLLPDRSVVIADDG